LRLNGYIYRKFLTCRVLGYIANSILFLKWT